MEQQSEISKNIIDKRAAATHSLAWLIGLFVGLFTSPGHSVQDRDRDLVQVVSTALDRGQAFWEARVPGWHDAHVVLFTKAIDTPCGVANDLTGPFYCPGDEHIYVDLAFLRKINGDLGQAYVIAHELGHHVQNIVDGLDVRGYQIELQADCYAGIWMNNEMDSGYLQQGDLNEAYLEAAQVGDVGAIDTWTHGDAEHRVAAVRRGFKTGQCNL